MKIFSYIFVLILSHLYGFILCGKCKLKNEDHLILKTLGGQVKGDCEKINIFYETKPEEEVDIISWQSIPYAEPPVGNLRFANPVPKKSWTNIIDGTKSPNACMAHKDFKQENDKFSENCLYVNIDVPYESYVESVINKNPSKQLPIFVWIHGGAFMFGSVNEYDGKLPAAASNMIVIRISYRLGVFGFFYLKDTDAKGNQAIMDQSLALKWVYDNAERFGGDKNRITIAGESAGGWSVGQHLLFKPSWQYFDRAILQSGFPTDVSQDDYPSPDEATSLYLDAMDSSLNCNDKNSNKDVLECLQKADVNQVNDVFHNGLAFPKFVKGSNNMIDQTPETYFESGDYKKCNILNGYTNYEQLSLADLNIRDYLDDLKKNKYDVFIKVLNIEITDDMNKIDEIVRFYIPQNEIGVDGTNYYRYYIDILSDYVYKCTTHDFAELVSHYNDNVYIYEYAHKSSNTQYPDFDGAAHAAELDFNFGGPLSYEKYDKADKLFDEKMIEYWGSFVTKGYPSKDWFKYNSLNSKTKRNVFYLRYNELKNFEYDINNKKCSFWKNLKIKEK